VKATKTGVARRFSVEPQILPLLRRMHEEGEAGGAVVLTMPPIEVLATTPRHDASRTP